MRKQCAWQGAGHDTLLLTVFLVLVPSCVVRVQCDCQLGVLKPASIWTVTNRHIVNSIVPDVWKPVDITTQSRVPFRPSEAQIYAEVRPTVPPAQQSRICLRSMSSVSAACSTGRVVPAADSLAPTDPESFIYNVTEGMPQGPCLLLNEAGTAAQLKQERPRPPSCNPGAGYCSDSSTAWSLSTNSTAGKQLVWLSIVRTIATYQDTDDSTEIMTTTIPFQVTDGCVLQASVTRSAAAAAGSSCLDCTNKHLSVQPVQRSSSCLHCPVRSSKPNDAAALAAGSGSWRCIPGMPKGFESITVRMGTGGNPECASVNGKTCLRNIGAAKTCQAMAALLNPGPSVNRPSPAVITERVTAEAGVPVLKPLTCGAAHAAVWPGVTGYTTPGHWCLTSRDWLQDAQPLVLGRCNSQA